MFSVFRSVFLLLYLLLEMVLFTSAALIAQERQRDVAACVEVPTRVLSGAADEAPQPPQNLVVFPQSSTSIMLTWQAPSDTTDLDHYAVYVEDEDMEDTTTALYYIFYNLEACTDYTFGVRSVSAAGDMSDPLLGEGQTGAGAPPAPQNLQVDGYTSTTVTLSWDKPDTLCDVEQYRVTWNTEGIDPQSTTTSETSFTVKGLSENTAYIFSVFASTSYGDGPEATVQQTTAVFDGGPPENLVAVGVSSSAINVSWSPAPGEPQYYLVFSMLCMPMQDMVFGLSYLITGLDPCDSCEISVKSHYEDTTEYEANVGGTTDGGDPPPPESCSVQEEEGGLAVTWERPVSDCSLGSHSIHWTGTKLWGDGGKESGNGTTSGTGTRYYVPDPVPYSQYTFEIAASIDGVFGSPAFCSGTSMETQPGPPVILAVDSVQGEAVVTWETPVEENGLIANYGIFVDETTDPQKTVSGDMHRTSLELEPCQTFGISVKAKNGAGWGLPSEVKNVTVVDDDGGPPEDLVAVGVSSSAINVSWSPAPDEPQYYLVSAFPCMLMEDMVFGLSCLITGLDPCESCEIYVTSHYMDTTEYTANVEGTTDGGDPPPLEICSVQVEEGGLAVTWERPVSNCFLDSFSIHWTGTKLWGDGGKENGSATAGGTVTRYNVSDPVPYSQYTFEIAASIDGVFGSPASCSGTSMETQPGSPVIVAVDSVQGEAVVTWETPVEENGRIVKYGIFVDEETDPQKTVSRDVHSASLELEPCKTFDLSVKAKNGAGWGPPSEVKNVTVVDDDPVPPENCSVQVEESALTVIWEKPDTACGLGAYRVDWTNTKLWGNGDVESGGTDTTATDISVVDPVPYCEYLFNVSSSINGVIGKQSASCSGTSLEAPASPPTELLQVAMDVSSVTVQWSLPESLRGRLLGWYLNWTSAIGHYLGEQYVTNPEERMFQIGDLDPSEVYNVYVMAVNGAGKGELAMLETSTEYVP